MYLNPSVEYLLDCEKEDLTTLKIELIRIFQAALGYHFELSRMSLDPKIMDQMDQMDQNQKLLDVYYNDYQDDIPDRLLKFELIFYKYDQKLIVVQINQIHSDNYIVTEALLQNEIISLPLALGPLYQLDKKLYKDTENKLKHKLILRNVHSNIENDLEFIVTTLDVDLEFMITEPDTHNIRPLDKFLLLPFYNNCRKNRYGIILFLNNGYAIYSFTGFVDVDHKTIEIREFVNQCDTDCYIYVRRLNQGQDIELFDNREYYDNYKTILYQIKDDVISRLVSFKKTNQYTKGWQAMSLHLYDYDQIQPQSCVPTSYNVNLGDVFLQWHESHAILSNHPFIPLNIQFSRHKTNKQRYEPFDDLIEPLKTYFSRLQLKEDDQFILLPMFDEIFENKYWQSLVVIRHTSEGDIFGNYIICIKHNKMRLSGDVHFLRGIKTRFIALSQEKDMDVCLYVFADENNYRYKGWCARIEYNDQSFIHPQYWNKPIY